MVVLNIPFHLIEEALFSVYGARVTPHYISRRKSAVIVMSFKLSLFLSVVSLASCTYPELVLFRTLDDFSFNAKDHLTTTHVLFSETGCDINLEHIEHLNPAFMSEEVQKLFGIHGRAENQCAAVCVLEGAPKHLLHAVLPQHKYNKSASIGDWLVTMAQKERGWVSFYHTDLHVYWVPAQGDRVQVALLRPGEKNTVWLSSIIGHTFHLVNQDTGEIVATTYVKHDGVQIIGDVPRPELSEHPHPEEVTAGVRHTLQSEYARSLQVKRTFSPLGFDKGRLPEDIYCSMMTYYNNNYANVYLEEWVSFHVNWWEADNWMVGMPWGLKKYWQERLRHLVEEWAGGVSLENTDIYGIRRYDDGAWLLSHTDREETHAVSVIINLDQEEMREDWMVEIYDFAGRLHEIPMKPGEIVYYESARCLHGRMTPLDGRAYANLFSHYRPTGDPNWFEKENPPGSAIPLISVGDCKLEQHADGSEAPLCGNALSQYLSPKLETITDGDGLFVHWLDAMRRAGKLAEPMNT